MTPQASARILATLAKEVGARVSQVTAAVGLLDEGATVPFIARYRKEVTDGLDDTQLRLLEERLHALRELESRRASILQLIDGQGKLTDALRAAIDAADSRQVLEDLYLPYKVKRKTRAQTARDAGLEPLALALRQDRSLDPKQAAQAYVNAQAGVADVKAALEGARDILAETFAEDPAVLADFRVFLWEEGLLSARRLETVTAGADTEKFRDYFEHDEPIATLPSHRALALLRGRAQGVLKLALSLGEAREALVPHPCVARLGGLVGLGAVFGAQPQP
ncbi:MAG: Tex-like N-terminal domain-containing protein, partial [Burkholderiales bacterium]